MPTYRYVAVAPDGSQVKAAVEAMSEESLRNELVALNFEVVRVKQKRTFTQVEITKKRVPANEIMHFSRQIAAFVRSGIPIVDALEVVEEGTSNSRFRAVLADMRESIQGGVPFAEAVAAHADLFPSYYVGILRAAEYTGHLDDALDQLGEYIERDVEARHTVRSALTYPAVVAVMSVATVVILATYVLPKFADFFQELDSELPAPTRLLLAIAGFMQSFWWIFPLLAAGLVLLVYLGKTTDRGRQIRDRMLLRTPLIGDIVLYAVVERFSRIVGAMIAAGVPLPDAMDAAIGSVHNKVFEDALVEARESMLEGDGLAEPLAATGLFPRPAIQMMRVGEGTGTLDHQLENAATYYSRELAHKLKRLTSLFEPAVIIFMGLIVGFVAVALISAMYGVFQGQTVGVGG